MPVSKKYVYITDKEWFESCGFANPIEFPDHKLEELYPQFYKGDYDLRLLVSDAPTKAERDFFAYNDYRDRYGSFDIEVVKTAAQNSPSKNIFLNSFRQEHFEYLAPFIKDTAEMLYLFKCRQIKNLSVLSDFKKLRCVLILGNNSLEELWDMRENKDLTVISLEYTTKLSEIDALRESNVEYFTLDSMDNSGNKTEFLISDVSIFDEVPKLKHLKLVFRKVDVDY